MKEESTKNDEAATRDRSARSEAAADGAALLEVRDVSKVYRRGPEEVHALRGVSLSIHPREVVALFGPSGSGKSTLLNILFGWERADDGLVAWNDRGLGGGRPWSDMAIVPQSLGLLEELSVRENVELPMRLAAVDQARSAKRVDGFLAYLGLEGLAGRLPAEVSIGEQQRTALARALVLSPRLLLADEPTGHQDEEWARVVMRTLRLVTHRGTSCLIATHNEEAVRFADRVLAIRDGTIAQMN